MACTQWSTTTSGMAETILPFLVDGRQAVKHREGRDTIRCQELTWSWTDSLKGLVHWWCQSSMTPSVSRYTILDTTKGMPYFLVIFKMIIRQSRLTFKIHLATQTQTPFSWFKPYLWSSTLDFIVSLWTYLKLFQPLKVNGIIWPFYTCL